MNKYPEYVKKYRPKGTIVKKVREIYYVYKATSKKIEGKSYPVQVIEGLVGRIDEHGFHELTKTLVESKHVVIREYGFTNYLLLFEDNYIKDANCQRPKNESMIIFRSLIAYLSSNSYLIDDKKIKICNIEELIKKYKISVTKQLNAILRFLEEDNFENIEQLKYICRVKMGNKVFKSDLSDIQKQLIKQLGVDENEIR